MNKTLKALSGAIAVTGVLLLSGCGAPDSGYITDRKWSEAYTYYDQQCMMYNKDMICQMYIPVERNVPARYSFDIRDGDDHGWVSVTETTYSSYSVGDFYDNNR